MFDSIKQAYKSYKIKNELFKQLNRNGIQLTKSEEDMVSDLVKIIVINRATIIEVYNSLIKLQPVVADLVQFFNDNFKVDKQNIA